MEVGGDDSKGMSAAVVLGQSDASGFSGSGVICACHVARQVANSIFYLFGLQFLKKLNLVFIFDFKLPGSFKDSKHDRCF
jgi:hypothetical protein